MSDADHLQKALALIESMSKGQLDDSVLAEDVRWWIPGTGTVSREQFEAMVRAFNELRAAQGKMTVVGTTVQGDRVAVEAEAEIPLKNGSLYQNTYHFLFEFQNGKIRLGKEYNDSAAALRALGNIAGDF